MIRRGLVVFGALTVAVASGCVQGDACLRLSDCATNYVCMVGSCVPVGLAASEAGDVGAVSDATSAPPPTTDALDEEGGDADTTGEGGEAGEGGADGAADSAADDSG